MNETIVRCDACRRQITGGHSVVRVEGPARGGMPQATDWCPECGDRLVAFFGSLSDPAPGPDPAPAAAAAEPETKESGG